MFFEMHKLCAGVGVPHLYTPLVVTERGGGNTEMRKGLWGDSLDQSKHKAVVVTSRQPSVVSFPLFLSHLDAR
jgi:hypothetical protein